MEFVAPLGLEGEETCTVVPERNRAIADTTANAQSVVLVDFFFAAEAKIGRWHQTSGLAARESGRADT